MHKAVVTGGGGFIGSAIVRALVARGDQVTVVGRSRYPELSALGVTCLQGDIADHSFLNRSFKGADLVFHVAAKAGIWGPWQEYVHTNIIGTASCVNSCKQNNVPVLVYTSTPSVVFDRHDLCGVDEATPYTRKTLCHYATSKIIAEKGVVQANDSKLRTVSIRPHLVWGPGDPHLIPRILERGRRNQLKIIGNGRNRVDIAYIDNVVHAHLLAADNLLGKGSAAGRVFFIGQQQPVVLWNWINDLLIEKGVDPVCRRIPFFSAYLLGGILEAVYSTLKLVEEPGMTRFVALQLARSHWFSHQAAWTILGYEPIISTEKGMERLLFSSGESGKR
jgi:nucleoside-diphosphate-sugar epimerase